ncbi:major facilitator superfamily domain-containing protein [Annulohypoxylon moriforme]|nr:major facilitator superfamily domain-containing protein [Annulohypoxylon moriforme]
MVLQNTSRGDDPLEAVEVDGKDSVVELEKIHTGRARHVPPEYIRSLSTEERRKAERALVRRIDMRLIPPVIFMYLLNYIDRNNIASARLGGLEEDLNLKGTQYQTCVSILFVGYILMQVPSNLLLNKIGKPSIYIPTCMMIWGIISTATAAAQNFGGLLAIRFLLGFVEAPYFPGCLFFLSSWYTRQELAFRTAMLYSGSLISGAFSGLIAAGIVNGMDDVHGLRAWRWLFIIEGSVTVVLAFSMIPLLPDFPRTTNWLSEEEKILATWRLEEDIGEDDWASSGEQKLWRGFFLAIKDIKTWVLMVLLFCIIFAASVTNFFPSVVQTLGYSSVDSLLLTVPPYILAVIATFTNTWHADRTKECFYHIILPLFLAVASFVIAASTTTTAPRYLSMCIMLPSLYCGFVVALGWIAGCIPRPPAKRAAALALVTAFGNSSSIYASYMFLSNMAPRYVLAMSMCCAVSFLAIGSATVLRVILVRLNKKLELAAAGDEAAIDSLSDAVPVEAARRGFRFII